MIVRRPMMSGIADTSMGLPAAASMSNWPVGRSMSTYSPQLRLADTVLAMMSK